MKKLTMLSLAMLCFISDAKCMNQNQNQSTVHNQGGFMSDAHDMTSRYLTPHNLKVFLEVWGCNIGFGIGLGIGILIMAAAYGQA